MVTDEHGEHFDLIGRSVVLAFRLTGMKADFPSIVSQREIVEATIKEGISQIKFKKLNLSAEDRQRYFKGERWGTTNLYSSAERRPRPRSTNSLLRTVRKTIAEAEKPQTIQDETDPSDKAIHGRALVRAYVDTRSLQELHEILAKGFAGDTKNGSEWD